MNTQILKRYYELETAFLRFQRRQDALIEEIKQAKFDLRGRDEALLNYQGSVRSLLDGFSGKREEKAEELRRHVRRAEAELAALQREQQEVETRLARVREGLNGLPDAAAIRSEADEKAWAGLEAKYCAEVLSPLLAENHKALLEYRSLMRGEYPILSRQTQQEMLAEPNVWAEQCVPFLHRLKEALDILEMPFETGGYYDSPTAYLVYAAADHNRRDRVNQALDQVEKIQKLVIRILEQEG